MPRMRVDFRPIASTVPARLVVGDRVAAAERAVEDDRQRGEQVGEDALRGEADRDAADAETGDQPGDVDPEIVEHDAPARSRTATNVTSRRISPIALTSASPE